VCGRARAAHHMVISSRRARGGASARSSSTLHRSLSTLLPATRARVVLAVVASILGLDSWSKSREQQILACVHDESGCPGVMHSFFDPWGERGTAGCMLGIEAPIFGCTKRRWQSGPAWRKRKCVDMVRFLLYGSSSCCRSCRNPDSLALLCSIWAVRSSKGNITDGTARTSRHCQPPVYESLRRYMRQLKGG
jgi:hypothetical protein